MAIYHLSVSNISRQNGQSAVASAAYRSAEKLYDKEYDKTHNYTPRKNDVAYSGIFLPENAPERLQNRETLWNEVSAIESRKNARLCREINAALPVELSPEQNIALAKSFAEYFSEKGMVADLAIHDIDSYNPHLHMMLTTRELDSSTDSGWCAKKNTDWNKKEELESWREKWAELTNEKLAQANCEQRVSEKSYEEQGIEKVPSIHEGVAVRAMERKAETAAKDAGIEYKPVTGIRVENLKIREANSTIDNINEKIKIIEQKFSENMAALTVELKQAKTEAYQDFCERFQAIRDRIGNFIDEFNSRDEYSYDDENYYENDYEDDYEEEWARHR